MSTTRSVSSMLKDILESEDFLSAISNAVERKLGEIIDRINQQENRITKLESESKEAGKLIAGLQSQILRNNQNLLDKCEKLESADMDLANDKDSRSQHISSLEQSVKAKSEEVKRLMKEVNNLEQYSRRSCLRIVGVKEEKEGESTDEMVMEVAKRIGVNLDVKDIDRSHRIRRRTAVVSSTTSDSADEGSQRGNRKKEKKCSIIVKFCSYRTRQQFFVNRRKLKNSGISIHEDLTASNFSLLQNVQKNEKIGVAWSMDGRIFGTLKSNGKKHLIKSIEDLKLL